MKVLGLKIIFNRVLDKILNIRFLLVCNIIIFLLKIINNCIFGFPMQGYEDWGIANNVAKFGVYSEFINVGPTAYKLPMYPLFLSIFIYLFSSSAGVYVVVVQHIIFFFIPFFIVYMLKLFKRNKEGIFAALIFTFSPAYVYYSSSFEATVLFIPLFLIWLIGVSKVYLGLWKSFPHFILFSFLTALLFLTQIVVVPFASLLLLFLLLDKRIDFRNFIFIILISFLFYSPWIIRNKIVFDKWVFTKTPTWQNIYLSYTDNVNVFSEFNLITKKKEFEVFENRKKIDEFQMENIYESITQSALKNRKSLIVKKGLQNIMLLWYVPSKYFYENSFSILFGRKIFVIILNLITMFSLIYYYKNNKKFFLFFCVMFILFTLPYMIGHAGNIRFKLDFEWLQYILVAFYLLDIFRLKLSKD